LPCKKKEEEGLKKVFDLGVGSDNNVLFALLQIIFSLALMFNENYQIW
jgi:hypothetical protein